MPKTITLRLEDEIYKKFSDVASDEHRSISNLIEILALKKLDEDMLADDFEMKEIFSNTRLLEKLEKGHSHTKMRKGRLVG
ncbi:MAG: CopG family transcriptional regulator [Nitrospirae bacterium]|nr:CopG family transcriptional regulator [Nitrospirota bacterium]